MSRTHILTLTLAALVSSPAVAEEESPETEKKGTVVTVPDKRAALAPAAEPPRAESVGALAAPTAQELDEGPVTEHRKTLTWIGFHQAKDYSRLFFKTTERVAFDVTPATGVIRVALRNTRARLRNNLRFLDTSYFPSAVWRVIPRQAGKDVIVEIQMREAVNYKVRRRMETIHIDFELPSKK